MALISSLTRCLENLRTAFSLGADRAILLKTDKETDSVLQPIHCSNLISQFITKNNIDVVLLGKQAIDDDYNQTGQMIGGLLGWPFVTNIAKLDYNENEGKFNARREIDGGTQEVKTGKNSVFTCDLRLNKPRLPKLTDIMKAKKKTIEIQEVDEEIFGQLKAVEVLSFEQPVNKKNCQMLKDVDELASVLNRL